MFGELVIWYLFLGGVGGGACIVSLAVGFEADRKGGAWHAFSSNVRESALLVALLALVVGAVCLYADLSRSDKVLLLFVRPTFSAISIGAYSLTALILCICYLVGRQRFFIGVLPRATQLIELLTFALACIVVVYTGLLLSNMRAVGLWHSPFLPVVFSLSAVSTGMSILLLAGVFVERDRRSILRTMSKLAKADAIVIALEALFLVVFLFQASGNAGAERSLDSLFFGSYSLFFWVGFVAFGIAVPLVGEAFLTSAFGCYAHFYLCLSFCILVGGFFLRFCVVNAGAPLSALLFSSL